MALTPHQQLRLTQTFQEIKDEVSLQSLITELFDLEERVLTSLLLKKNYLIKSPDCLLLAAHYLKEDRKSLSELLKEKRTLIDQLHPANYKRLFELLGNENYDLMIIKAEVNQPGDIKTPPPSPINL